MKLLLTILAGALLAACGGNVATVDPRAMISAAFPAGGPPDRGCRSPRSRCRQAFAGADRRCIYRLAYAEPLRRRSYAESRWAAPPAELLQAFLERRFVFPEADASGPGCRLQLVLDEFEQRFDDPQQSRRSLKHVPR
jgi:cholesterol transport system auxiliary component